MTKKVTVVVVLTTGVCNNASTIDEHMKEKIYSNSKLCKYARKSHLCGDEEQQHGDAWYQMIGNYEFPKFSISTNFQLDIIFINFVLCVHAFRNLLWAQINFQFYQILNGNIHNQFMNMTPTPSFRYILFEEMYIC